MGVRQRKQKREEEEALSSKPWSPPSREEINAQLDRDIANLEAQSAAKKQVVLMTIACALGLCIIAMLSDPEATWEWIKKHT